MGETVSRQVQNALVIIAVVLTSPIWGTLLWNMLAPFGTAENLAIVIVGVFLGGIVVVRSIMKRRSRLAEDGQGPSGPIDV